MMVHTKELTLRVRANEKVIASVSLLGVIACTFIGAGYFAPKAEAHMGHSFPTWPTAGEMIHAIRDQEARENRTSVEDMLNNTLMEYENGSNGSTKSEELLQLSSNED